MYNTIIMYFKFETSHCPMCKQAERLLQKHNVTYQSVDAEQADALVEFYGIHSVPCIIEAESLGEPASKICRAPQSEAMLVAFLNK